MTRRARIAAAGLCVAAALATIGFAFNAQQRVLRRERAHLPADINDFARWMVLVPRLAGERADYVDDGFPNPPVTLLFLMPFTKLSPATAQFVWICGKPVMAGVILLLVLSMARRARMVLTGRAIGLILAVWVWPVIGDLQAGQTDLLMLLPLVGGLALAQLEGPRLDWGAGFLIALAISIKVTPLAFLAYLLFRRRWSLALATALGVAAWLLVVPGIAFGWQQNLRWLGQWQSIMITPYVVHGRVDYFVGQSIPSVLSRFLRHVPAFVSRDGGAGEIRYANLVDLPEPTVTWIIRGVLLAIALAGAVWARRPLPTFRSRRYLMEIGCVAAFMLWASQRTWVPHYVALVLPLLAVATILSDPAEPASSRRRAAWALGASAGLMGLTSDVAGVFGPHGGEYFRTLGVSLWASVLLVATILTTGGPGEEPPLRPGPIRRERRGGVC